MNCPVCNKNDIPDYFATEVICPQCNTDLSVYRLLKLIDPGAVNNRAPSINLRRRVLFAVTIVVAGLLIAVIVNISVDREIVQRVSAVHDTLKTLRNDLSLLKSQKDSTTAARYRTFRYIVKKHDNLISIAKYFFNDPSPFRSIASENQIESPFIIQPGDTLKINGVFIQWK